jgi:hypothetical protein
VTDAERLAAKREWFQRQLAAIRAREYRATINLDALNDYYGFHGRCLCESSGSATHTPPPTISTTPEP